MRKIIGTILFIFLIILSTAGVAAYVMQEAFQEPITFKEFFEMVFLSWIIKKEAVRTVFIRVCEIISVKYPSMVI